MYNDVRSAQKPRRTVWAVNRGQAASRWTGRSLTDLFLIAFSGFLFRDRY